MSSKCIIQIKIGDQIITLDPNSNISASSKDFLINTLDVSKLRSLYSNLKESINSSDLGSPDKGLVSQGEATYNALVEQASKDGEFLSPTAALKEATTQEQKTSLAAYVSSLDSSEVLSHGNYLLDMKDSYKLSPFSHNDIRNLVFGGSTKLQLGLYNQLTSVPGMETLRISVAQADDVNGTRVDKPSGAYLRPDNIIQVVVPDDPKYYIHGVNDGSGINKANLTKAALKDVRDTILHELNHAVYSEAYISDPKFRKAIGDLHKRYIDYLATTNKVEQSKLKSVYSDVHEFLSDMFVNRELQQSLNEMKSKDSVYESLGRGNLYKFLYDSLPEKFRMANSSLKDAFSIMTDALPTNVINDTFQKRELDYVDPADKKNLFFMNDGVTLEENETHLSPQDQTQSYWSINARAYRAQKAYLDRVTYDKDADKVSLKDAHYEENVDSPSTSQIDRLYENDLALIPWLRYNALPDGKGSWVEQGVLTRGGKDVMEDGKPKIVDIQRGTDNKIKPYKGSTEAEDGTVSPRYRHVPVMYSNIKAGKVVVAKVGLDPAKQGTKEEGYNTISIPYSFVKGIRKYDWRYFDHTHDYETDLKEAKAALVKSNTEKFGPESKNDRVSYYEKLVSKLEGNVVRATQVRQELSDLYKQYAFQYADSDGEAKTLHKNISGADYDALGYSKDNIGSTRFSDPESAIYTVKKIKDAKFPTPNPKIFEVLWESTSGKDFAKASSLISEAVTKGDMVKIHKTVESKDGTTVNQHDWLPVYRRVANGVQVGTLHGQGKIIPFNNIDAYAKNTRTEAWANLMLSQKDVIDSFEDNMYQEKKEGERFARTNTEAVKFRPLTYDANISKRGSKEVEEDLLTRFNKYKEGVIKDIRPNESFVKVARRFLPDPLEKKVKDYQSLELVIAKSDEGLVTLRMTQGKAFKIDHVKFSDTIADSDNYGKELLFLLEDQSAIKNLWKDFSDEKDLFKENASKPAFTNEGTATEPKWKPNFDLKSNPRSFRDWYDFHDDVNGVKIARLRKGDVIGVKIDNSQNADLPEFYFRKVLRVMDDGRVSVVNYRAEDTKFKNGGVGKAGIYSQYIKPDNIARVGYKIGAITEDGEGNFISEYHQDVVDRRQKLLDYANRDRDYNDFKFATPDGAEKWNSKTPGSGKYKKFVPLTSRILEPKSTDPEVLLNRNLENVDDPKQAAWVQAWFSGDSIDRVVRGLDANSSFFKAKDILIKDGKYQKLNPTVKNALMPGDWVITTYKDKNGKLKWWSSPIDRIEGDNVYTINSDLTTNRVNFDKIVGVKTSVRNDAYKGQFSAPWKRSQELYKLLKQNSSDAKASLDLDFKSPKDSRRALYEIGNRLKELNPDIQLNYVEQGDLNTILKQTGFDYSNVRAFVKDGAVYINTDKASISDVVHEYAHLFLHSMKYDSPQLYDAIISKTNAHPLYDDIASEYKHLTNKSDIDEEVFVTLLGEYMKGSLDSRSAMQMDQNKDVIVQFSKYTKDKLDHLMSGNPHFSSDIDPNEILNMRVEDVMQLVGDHIMNNRISSTEEVPTLEFGHDVEKMLSELKKRGMLTQECYA